MDWESSTCVGDRVVSLKNLHLDQQFTPAYSNPTSPQFLRLATFLQRHIMTSYNVRRDVIRGVKVTHAREGSVVVDVGLLHADNVTSEEAFESFVGSLFRSEFNLLRIKTHILPLLFHGGHSGEKVSSSVVGVVVVAVVVPVSTLMVIVSLFLLCRNRKMEKEVKKISAHDNNGVEIVS